jgi:hypothetical protein
VPFAEYISGDFAECIQYAFTCGRRRKDGMSSGRVPGQILGDSSTSRFSADTVDLGFAVSPAKVLARVFYVLDNSMSASSERCARVRGWLGERRAETILSAGKKLTIHGCLSVS